MYDGPMQAQENVLGDIGRRGHGVTGTRESQRSRLAGTIARNLEKAHALHQLADNLRGRIIGENGGRPEVHPEASNKEALEPSGLLPQLAIEADAVDALLQKASLILEQIQQEV